LYLKGEGVEKDTEKAILLLEKSSEMGYAGAKAELAVLTEKDNPGRVSELYSEAADKENRDTAGKPEKIIRKR